MGSQLFPKPPICQTARSQHSAIPQLLWPLVAAKNCETLWLGVVGGSPSVVQHPRLHQHEPKTGPTLHPSSLFFGSVFFLMFETPFLNKKTFTSKVYLPALDIRSHIWWTVLGVFVKGLACQLHSQKLWMQQGSFFSIVCAFFSPAITRCLREFSGTLGEKNTSFLLQLSLVLRVDLMETHSTMPCVQITVLLQLLWLFVKQQLLFYTCRIYICTV